MPSVGKGAIFGRKTIVPWGLIELKSKKETLVSGIFSIGFDLRKRSQVKY